MSGLDSIPNNHGCSWSQSAQRWAWRSGTDLSGSLKVSHRVHHQDSLLAVMRGKTTNHSCCHQLMVMEPFLNFDGPIDP
mgnify:CR=1 FL=1